MTKRYYHIEPMPGTVLLIDEMTGEQYDVVALDGRFDDEKVAAGWCAVLNERAVLLEGVNEDDRGKYRVIRCQKLHDAIRVRARTSWLRKELEAIGDRHPAFL